MRVLVACEFSGVAREAFRKKGHEAFSCDFLETEIPGNHYQTDVVDILMLRCWDLIIAHPPCTKLTVAANRWYANKPDEIEEAVNFAVQFFDYAEKVCVENPVGRLSTHFRKPDQIIQPYEFGHSASKKTCLWLQNLPKLETDPAKRVTGRFVDGKERFDNQTDSGQNVLGPSETRWMDRSRTYQGIADAMAEQWG